MNASDVADEDREASLADRRPPPWVRRAIVWWWAIAAVLWLVLLLARELRSLLVQIVLALFLSFAIEPIVDRLEQRGIRRGIGTLVSLLLLVAAFVGFLAAMGSLIAEQLNTLIDELPAYITSAQGWLSDTVGVEVSADDLIEQLQPGGEASRYATDLAGDLVGFGTTIANLLFQTLTVLIFTFYFAADGPRLRQNVCSLFPARRQYEVLRIWELAVNKTGGYISSRFILAIASAMFHWVVFTSLGLPSAVALAIWVGVISQFIPAIGTYLAGILPMLVALGVEPAKAIWVLIAVIVYQQVENYVLQPRVTAQTLDMHPAVAVGAVLAGTSLFGAPGALLALPVVATISGFVAAYVERHEVVENQLAGATSILVADPATAAHDAEGTEAATGTSVEPRGLSEP